MKLSFSSKCCLLKLPAVILLGTSVSAETSFVYVIWGVACCHGVQYGGWPLGSQTEVINQLTD